MKKDESVTFRVRSGTAYMAAFLCAAFSSAPLLADYTEPIYVVTVAAGATNELASSSVEVTEDGVTTTSAFSDLTLSAGTIFKRGAGFILSDDGMSTFTGGLIIEEGGWIATAQGHLGQTKGANDPKSSVVISNGASVVFNLPSTVTGSPLFRHVFTFEGEGADGRGAICIENGKTFNDKLFHNETWVMTGDATIGLANSTSSVTFGYQKLNMNGHTLTFRGFGEGTGSTFTSNNLKLTDAGDIRVEGTRWVHEIPSAANKTKYALTGSSENSISLSRATDYKNDAWFSINGMDPTSPWTIRSEDNSVLRSSQGLWGSTNYAAWAGPVEIVNGKLQVSGNVGNSFSFLNTVSGAGGLICSRGQQITLASPDNSFEGQVRVNSNREGDGELCLYVDGALPESGAGAELDNSSLYMAGKRGTYHLPALEFDVEGADVVETFRGGTNSVAKSLLKTGTGILDVSAPVTVTGVTEIAAGTLRIPYAYAGLIAGCKPSVENVDESPYYELDDIDSLVLTNRVSLDATVAYTSDYGWWIRDLVTWGGRALFTYHGYLWNHSSTNETWTFAMGVRYGGDFYLNGEHFGLKAVGVTSRMLFANRTVKPGPNRFDMRIYSMTTYGPTYSYNLDKTYPFTNCTWKSDFGFAMDPLGRGSTNAVDYISATDPGDGSLLTVSETGTEGYAARLPSFEHVKMTGGTLDLRGSDLTIPVLEGANGVVTNGNAYFSGGTLTVGEKWVISGTADADKTLDVATKLAFAEGCKIEIEDMRSLPRNEQVIVTAAGGIEGSPSLAEKYGRWILHKSTQDGKDALKLEYMAGSVIILQ